MSKPKQFDDSQALNETVGRMSGASPGAAWEGYISGEVLTPHGIVAAYSEIENAQLDFVWRGRLYLRCIERGYTAKGLARKARQFADEVVERGQ